MINLASAGCKNTAVPSDRDVLPIIDYEVDVVMNHPSRHSYFPSSSARIAYYSSHLRTLIVVISSSADVAHSNLPPRLLTLLLYTKRYFEEHTCALCSKEATMKRKLLK